MLCAYPRSKIARRNKTEEAGGTSDGINSENSEVMSVGRTNMLNCLGYSVEMWL